METQRITNFPLNEELTHAFLIPFAPAKEPNRAAIITVGTYLTIGRDPCCDLVIKDEFVSSRHARIERKSTGFTIRDLHSRNGTFLNGSRVTEANLSATDRLRFGESVYIFSESAVTCPSASSKNPAWSRQLERLPTFAATTFPVLITGPSGSGKEILAREIHDQSARAKAPFVSINCSALSESLIESELFGHVKGSFTGATHDRKGAFECARGGTLFLDEIGDLPLALQPKLLRAIENNEIRPVGADRTIETDIRIVAATHKNLVLQVKQGYFREDLFYRLNVCQLRPPALNQRPEDFEDLLYQFAKQYRVRFSFNAIEKLKNHSWPGNIRELKNMVARASAYFPGKHLQPEDLPAVLETPILEVPAKTASLPAKDGTSGNVIKEIEREMIIQRLIANQCNQRRTAEELGIPKSTLHDRLKTYCIDLKQLALKSTDLIKA